MAVSAFMCVFSMQWRECTKNERHHSREAQTGIGRNSTLHMDGVLFRTHKRSKSDLPWHPPSWRRRDSFTRTLSVTKRQSKRSWGLPRRWYDTPSSKLTGSNRRRRSSNITSINTWTTFRRMPVKPFSSTQIESEL